MSKKGLFKNASPVCPLDGFCDVYPLAVVTLTSMAFTTIGITALLPLQVLEALCFYSAGLLHLDKKPTSVRIAERLGIKSHDRLTRLLSRDQWSCTTVMLALLRFAQRIGGGYLILDDVLLPKPRSCKIAGTYWDYDHSEGRSVYGIRIVVILWSNGLIKVPIAFAIWHKKGKPDKRNKRPVGRPSREILKHKSKNEIARTLLKWIQHRGMNPEYVTFDNWYASKDNLRFIQKNLKWTFYTKLKSNTKLHWEGRRLQTRTIGRRLLEQVRPYRMNDLKAQARCTLVRYGNLGQLTFTVAQHDAEKGKQRGSLHYLLTNEPNACARRTLIRYRSRWEIEVFFRDCKQHLGLGAYQGRSLDGVYHHITAVFLSATCLQLSNRKPPEQTLGDVKKTLQRLLVYKPANKPAKLIVLDTPLPNDLEGEWVFSQNVVGLMERSIPTVEGLQVPTVPSANTA